MGEKSLVKSEAENHSCGPTPRTRLPCVTHRILKKTQSAVSRLFAQDEFTRRLIGCDSNIPPQHRKDNDIYSSSKSIVFRDSSLSIFNANSVETKEVISRAVLTFLSIAVLNSSQDCHSQAIATVILPHRMDAICFRLLSPKNLGLHSISRFSHLGVKKQTPAICKI